MLRFKWLIIDHCVLGALQSRNVEEGSAITQRDNFGFDLGIQFFFGG